MTTMELETKISNAFDEIDPYNEAPEIITVIFFNSDKFGKLGRAGWADNRVQNVNSRIKRKLEDSKLGEYLEKVRTRYKL